MWARQVTDGTFAPMRFARAGGSSLTTLLRNCHAAYMYEIVPAGQAYGTVAWMDWFGINSESSKRHG